MIKPAAPMTTDGLPLVFASRAWSLHGLIARTPGRTTAGSARSIRAKSLQRTAFFLVIGLVIMTACSPTRLADPPTPTTVGVTSTLMPTASQTLFDQDLGLGSFEFGGHGPYPDVAIDVFYAAPSSPLDSVPILIVMPRPRSQC